jgi:L-lactate utilization protein LutB
MLSEQWKQKKQDFLKRVLRHEITEDDSFFKVDDSQNQNKTYAAGTPWTTLIKDSSMVNSRVFVRENYHNHDIFTTESTLGNAILSCAVKKATYMISENTDRDYYEIYEALKNYFQHGSASGKDLTSIVKSLRDIDHEELFN